MMFAGWPQGRSENSEKMLSVQSRPLSKLVIMPTLPCGPKLTDALRRIAPDNTGRRCSMNLSPTAANRRAIKTMARYLGNRRCQVGVNLPS